MGLSAFSPEKAAFRAGRILLSRVTELANAGESFAFETTLATRSFAPWLKRRQREGYRVHLLFLWLPNVEMAIARVAERVRLGGHDIPEEVIRRRYVRGTHNLRRLYLPFADSWRLIDASVATGFGMIAQGGRGGEPLIYSQQPWRALTSES